MRQSIKGISKPAKPARGRKSAKPTFAGNKLAPTLKPGIVTTLPQEPESVRFGTKAQRASTEIVRAARVALAEAVLREMEVKKMTPMADKKSRSSGGRGYAQLDTIERMQRAHQEAMKGIRQGTKRKKP
jgi:hypothetical protein